jgi:hypothetical protein
VSWWNAPHVLRAWERVAGGFLPSTLALFTGATLTALRALRALRARPGQGLVQGDGSAAERSCGRAGGGSGHFGGAQLLCCLAAGFPDPACCLGLPAVCRARGTLPSSPSGHHCLAERGVRAQGTDIKLFRFNNTAGAGAWELQATAVSPHFFNANEDAAASAARWCLEAGEAEAEVTDQFSLEPGGRRVIFRGETSIWALLFPSDAAFKAFTEQYNDRLFANTYGVDNDEDNRAKVRPCWLRSQGQAGSAPAALSQSASTASRCEHPWTWFHARCCCSCLHLPSAQWLLRMTFGSCWLAA